MYSVLVGNKNGHKKAKAMIKNVVAVVTHNEYKDDL